MTNSERGEFSLRVGTRTYTLKLSVNAAVAIQEETGKTIADLYRDATKIDFKAIRTVIWILLQKHHAADFTDHEKVGDLIDDAGGIHVFLDALTGLAAANGGKDAKGRPQRAQVTGIGGRSASRRSESA